MSPEIHALNVKCEIYVSAGQDIFVHPIVDEEDLGISRSCFNHLRNLIKQEVIHRDDRDKPYFDIHFDYDFTSYNAQVILV